MEWKKNPTNYIVKRANELNGLRSDFCPMYVGSDTTMIVTTSTRKEANGTDISGVTGQKCADMFLTKRNDKGKWQKTELIQGESNSAYEDGACAFTPDGKMTDTESRARVRKCKLGRFSSNLDRG